MPYTHTSTAELKTALSIRLGDASKRFWTDTELGIWINEALRTFGVVSGFWRERGVITVSAATAFYDLQSTLSGSLVTPTVTDRDIIQSIQYALLEDASTQSSWVGTEQFTFDDVANAVRNRTNQFLSDTGIVITRSLVTVSSPPIGRQELAENIIDVRRAAWLGADPFDYYNPVWRSDERELTAASRGWSVTGGTPEAYSIMAPPPLQLQLAPIPTASGQLELLTVNSVSLDPVNAATVLGIPDDLTPAVKWGALADLLGIDGIARDPARAQFAEDRYQQYVQLGRGYPVIIHAELNGVPLIPCTLQELESSTPNWENSSGQPVDVAIAGPNMIALNPVPDGTYSVTLDVVRNADLSTPVQVGREQLDMILDYAESLAMFKVGGAEWHVTDRQAKNFLMQCVTYNQRLSAAASYAFSAAGQSQRQKQGIPRRLDGSMIGVGALRNG